jgi:hypothetical protein
MIRTHTSDTCEIICEDNGRKMVADILAFKENQYLTVAVEKELKLELRWNKNIYEGWMGKLSFVSDGPTITSFKKGR